MSKHVLLKDKAKVHLFLAGDSTVADYPASQAPMAGWGQMLGAFFSDEVVIQNEARCGKSSKSFILEGHFQRIVGKIGNGDYLFIQFGHNDEKPDGTEPFTTFQSFLSQYIDMARQKGATPVLVTPVHRRRFDEAGRLVNTHGEYPAAIRELSELRQVPLIDLCAATEGLYQSLGPEDSKQLFVWFTPGEHQNYTEGVEDNTHFSEYGAKEVARLVIERIADMGLPLTACM
nr:rhamnogalacturonan acetylesterase [Paenibacillus alginolyticus]